MTRVSWLALVFILTGCEQNLGKYENDLQKEGIAGDVTAVKTNIYRAENKFGELNKKSLCQKIYVSYNDSGNRKEVERHSSITGCEYPTSLFYNLIALESSPAKSIFSSRLSLADISKYKYEDSGDYSVTIITSKGEVTKGVHFENLGETHHATTFDGSGSRQEEINLYLDEHGRVKKTELYQFEDGGIWAKSNGTFSYNPENRPEKFTRNSTFNDDKSATTDHIWEYTKDGHVKEIKTEVTFSGNKSTERTSFDYLDFDKKGNWTKRLVVKYKDETPDHYIEERTLIYSDTPLLMNDHPEDTTTSDTDLMSTYDSLGYADAETIYEPEPPVVDMEDYKYFIEGVSTYREAMLVIPDSGEELSRTQVGGVVVIIHSWKNPDGSSMILTFQNGKLVSKSQYGLK